MYVVVEFTWTVQGFCDRIFRAVIHLCWIGLTVAFICAATGMHQGALATAGELAGNWLLFAFNVIGTGVNLVALSGRGGTAPLLWHRTHLHSARGESRDRGPFME
jgi:hypothetical protein